MMFLEELKNYSYWNNTLYDYLIALAVFVGVLILLKIFQAVILSKLKKLALKTKTDFDDAFIDVFKTIKPPFYFFVALYIGIKQLVLPEIFGKVIFILFLLVIVYEAVRALTKLVDYFANKYLTHMENSEKGEQQSKAMVKALVLMAKIVLWAIALILILGNLGIDVTSLIAGLGIGGIAIALALQGILSDIFSSFSIYIDKPFQIGDFIMVGTDGGTVEHIGLKSTRVRTLQGEELVISNKELTTTRVQNFKKLEKRRIAAVLGVTYGTPASKLKKIPTLVKKALKEMKIAQFDRCYFESFGDFSLNYEIIYFVKSSEMTDTVKVKNDFNINIYKLFEEEGIEFAYPTQTVHVESGGKEC
jgi:small-conductance mechanosensitive channel